MHNSSISPPVFAESNELKTHTLQLPSDLAKPLLRGCTDEHAHKLIDNTKRTIFLMSFPKVSVVGKIENVAMKFIFQTLGLNFLLQCAF